MSLVEFILSFQMQDQEQNPSVQNSNIGFPGANQSSMPEQKKNWKWLIVLILFLVVIGGVTFFVFKSSRSASSPEESPTPDTSSLTNVATPAPTSTPSSTPSDKTQIKIQILNGTGIAGEAGYLSDQLKKLSYTNLTPGNAPTQNATNTEVIFSSSVGSDVVTEITSKLKELYTNVTTNNSTLNSFDVQITTGLRKGQTSAPAATTSSSPTDTPIATPAQ